MKHRLFAEATFQIVLFLLIVSVGWEIARSLANANIAGAEVIGVLVAIALTMTIFFKWSQIFDRLWPRIRD